MEGGRWKEREKEGENHLDYKNDRKNLLGLQKWSDTHIAFF